MKELMEHLVKIIEDNSNRFNFEWQAGHNIEIYDKEEQIGYVLKAEEIIYGEDGLATNL